MAAATLRVGVLLAILEAAPEIRAPFRVDSHHSSKLGGKSQGGRRDRNQPYRESPQRECITLDRTRGRKPPTLSPQAIEHLVRASRGLRVGRIWRLGFSGFPQA